ncbi:MAG: arginine--tRNA ligase [Candidatus Wildermuthbacteria bacterium RIFCSPHIGHO2_01_FULL_48_27b]|uniref:Arginine--tRNA ligase n=1 Tax=Candidatus Wildermuthbacteria bacterium RIFCSPHIGHO2_01_FULL_48_27b TaxID=1802447 RepID=A0A1G2QT94_9BACT|nr:MAG: arginine--tRNA ligase [Candidatus Wildermuthbacteria bacterium RIFCSPHIGHO2_01_FULL_48_27b]
MVREELEKIIQKALRDAGFEAREKISLEHPEKEDHGDYATPVALQLAKQLARNPREVSELIVSAISKQQSAILDRVEVAGPGFINLYISKSYLLSELARVFKEGDDFGKSASLKGKKVMLEFTDPNPFKEFHIGHLYTNTVGESLSRMLQANGANAKRANYQGDVGMHVAKAIWGMKQLSHKMPKGSDSLSAKARWLGICYAAGVAGEDKGKEELQRINKAVYEGSDKEINKLYKIGRKWSLEYFEAIYKRLGTKFDFYYFESEVGKVGVKLVQENLKKGVFEESEGAIIFPGEKYGLHNRVFINSQGLPTYEAKELGLAPTKYKDFRYDLSVVITGNEVSDYFKVLLAALKQINLELAGKTKHIGHGMVRLPEGKMSSRTGNVITAEELLEEVKKRARVIAESSGSEITDKEKGKILEMVTVGAIKYAFLRVGIGKDLIFDFEKSLSLEGDSGPYLQYTYARCKSILRKAQKIRSASWRTKFEIRNSAELAKEELAVLRWLYRFPEVVTEAAEKFSPNLICNFVFELAQRYNHFYSTYSVLQAETEEQKQFRLLLTFATAQVIKNSLNLLGIKAPGKM